MYCCFLYLQIIHLVITVTQVNVFFEHVLGVYCLSSTEHTKRRKVFIKRGKKHKSPGGSEIQIEDQRRSRSLAGDRSR